MNRKSHISFRVYYFISKRTNNQQQIKITSGENFSMGNLNIRKFVHGKICILDMLAQSDL
jgi:hypothetical protein